MRILFGVVGEGMGHATRSRVLLDALAEDGHEVRVVASGHATGYLDRHFAGVDRIWGYTLATRDNEVHALQTALQNVRGAARGWPENVRHYLRLVGEFDPEVVISDFESFSYLFAKRHRLPVICVDNIQILDRCRHGAWLRAGHADEYAMARAIVAAKAPRASHYLVPTFFEPPLRKRRTTLVPSVLRPEVVAATPTEGDHLLVYQTAGGALPEILAASGVPCRVYGLRRDLEHDVVEGSVTYRPFSETGFVDDLCSARGVLAGGGFSLLSEAVYLHKPVLSIPIVGQFEQVMNARYLEHLGYGMHAARPTATLLGAFLERVPDYARALAGYRQDGNRVAVAALREQLDAASSR